MKAWFCYQCHSYHNNRLDYNQRSISYDDSLCLLWATGLAFPLKETQESQCVDKEKNRDDHDA
jgi:hypothetical protein